MWSLAHVECLTRRAELTKGRQVCGLHWRWCGYTQPFELRVTAFVLSLVSPFWQYSRGRCGGKYVGYTVPKRRLTHVSQGF